MLTIWCVMCQEKGKPSTADTVLLCEYKDHAEWIRDRYNLEAGPKIEYTVECHAVIDRATPDGWFGYSE